MVKTLRFHCWGHGFDSLVREQRSHTPRAAWPKKFFKSSLNFWKKIITQKKKNCRDFLGGPVVKNPPSNAEDAGSIPSQGTKIPRAVGQLSLGVTTTELTPLN